MQEGDNQFKRNYAWYMVSQPKGKYHTGISGF